MITLTSNTRFALFLLLSLSSSDFIARRRLTSSHWMLLASGCADVSFLFAELPNLGYAWNISFSHSETESSGRECEQENNLFLLQQWYDCFNDHRPLNAPIVYSFSFANIRYDCPENAVCRSTTFPVWKSNINLLERCKNKHTFLQVHLFRAHWRDECDSVSPCTTQRTHWNCKWDVQNIENRIYDVDCDL